MSAYGRQTWLTQIVAVTAGGAGAATHELQRKTSWASIHSRVCAVTAPGTACANTLPSTRMFQSLRQECLSAHKVGTNWAADTPALRKKANMLRGAAGPQRACCQHSQGDHQGKEEDCLKADAPVRHTRTTHARATHAQTVTAHVGTQVSLSSSPSSSDEQEVLIEITRCDISSY